MPGDMVLVRDDDDNRTPWKIRRYAFTFNDYVYCISKDGKIE